MDVLERPAVQPAGPAWDLELARWRQPATLLQSWAWGEIQGQLGWEVTRVLAPAPVTVLVRGHGAFCWGYVPRGPVDWTPDVLQRLGSWARDQGLARLRVEPEAGPEVRQVLALLGFRRTRQVQPAHTLIVPVGDEAAMLGSLRRSTRYNVRLALRRGVEVEEGDDASELARQVAWSAAHHRFRAPGPAYFRLLLDQLPWCRTYVARHRGRALAAMLVARHDGRAYYLFGGSCREHPELKPFDALVWAALRSAFRDGCRDFDLWGMPPGGDPRHPWHGFGQFKSGFGGRRVEYAGTWDLVLSERKNQLLLAQELVRRAARRVLRLLPHRPPR